MRECERYGMRGRLWEEGAGAAKTCIYNESN